MKSLKQSFGEDAFADVKHPHSIQQGKGKPKIELVIRELGYLELQSVYAKSERDGMALPALLVSDAVENADGDRFTYEEALSLRKDIAEPLFLKVLEVNSVGDNKAKN